MKFTMEEYRMMLRAVTHECDKLANESEVCRKQGRYMASGFYAECNQDYKSLLEKMCQMMDDITE